MHPGYKKAKERFHLERFLEASGLQAAILRDSDEAPDFIVSFEGRSVGVEVTEVFITHDDSNLPQTQDSIASRIVARAGERYRTSGAPHAHVSVHFAAGRDLRRLNMDSTASALADFVKSLNLAVGQRLEWRPQTADVHLPSEIAYLNMLGVERLEMSHWSSPRAGWVVPLTSEALQARIDDKAAKLASYGDKVSENWLLIASEGNKPSQFFEVRRSLE